MAIPDHVLLYSESAGLDIKAHTVFVEGTSDVEYFTLAARLEVEAGGEDLMRGGFAIVAAGERGDGGVDGLMQQLLTFRNLSKTYLNQSGQQVYRFLGLFDNDVAGRRALKLTTNLNASIVEFRDVICLYPIMAPAVGDPAAIGRAILKSNTGFNGIDWEIEDMLAPSFIDSFVEEYPAAIRRIFSSPGRHIHRELTIEGKAELLRYTRKYAVRADVDAVVAALHGLRCYVGIR